MGSIVKEMVGEFVTDGFYTAVTGDVGPTASENETLSTPSRHPPPISERLERLKSLHREGLITEEEYQKKKAEILEGL